MVMQCGFDEFLILNKLDILGRKAWVANLLLISFEIITVILLMNLMISLAVGDVNELRINAEERILKIKAIYKSGMGIKNVILQIR